jgi:hypothetical protein
VAGWDRPVGTQQDDVAVGVIDAEHQHLGREPGHPFGREVDHAHHRGAEQLVLGVGADLRAGDSLAERPEVQPELVGGPARFGEVAHVGDHGAADVDPEELLGVHGGQWLGEVALGQGALLLQLTEPSLAAASLVHDPRVACLPRPRSGGRRVSDRVTLSVVAGPR